MTESSGPSNKGRPSPLPKAASDHLARRWLVARLARAVVVLAGAGFAYYFAFTTGVGSGGLWKGLGAAHAVTQDSPAPYDLTTLAAVNDTLKKIQGKYVDPERIKPKKMFIGALNQVQREVAQVIVLHDERSPTVKVRVDTEEAEFRVDNVQGLWDVSARLREVFGFLQKNLRNTDVELREVEYAACNGILATLDPHSVFLSPEAYGEMNLSTSGHFGGLGIVISLRDQLLTIMRPMPGTPAGRAKLRRLDRITKINNESTLNMPLDDAVKRLRGSPGSKVTIWVHRDGKEGWAGARPFELMREEIRVDSVTSRELSEGVGYVRIQQFQATTADELEEALGRLGSPDKLKGLVLDLRGNPGGLLDQASKVADTFLDRGVIVSTVGASEGREEKRAKRRGTEPEYPIVVLINESSASASEIVSGALKNHDRAVVVGQTTFGKGTVQLVFSSMADGAALKLTIAQYLTPGDISIQGVGVTPDIELDPMTADSLEMDLYKTERRLRERDLSRSLTYGATRNADRPLVTLRYNLPTSERDLSRELGGDLEDEFRLDFPIRFARDLASRLPQGRRPEQLTQAKDFIQAEQDAQVQAISRELKQMGVDWSKAPEGGATGPSERDYEVKLSTDRPADSVTAGEAMTLRVAVTNKGSAPIYQLRAITKSDSGYYDEKELAFGRIDPGQTKLAEAPLGECRKEGVKTGSTKPVPQDAPRLCRIPLDAITRQDIVKVRFKGEGGEPPPAAELRPTVTSLPQPSFSYTYQLVDNQQGNGDGQLARGEKVSVYFDVKNIGRGRSHETQALLANLTGDGLLLRAGRFDISGMAPGETRSVVFSFDVLDTLQENLIKFELSVVDRDLHVAASQKVSMPVTTGGSFIKEDPELLQVGSKLPVHSQPVERSRVVGTLLPGSVVRQLGVFGEFRKIALDDGRFAFITGTDLKPTTQSSGYKFEPLFAHSPPWLEVEPATLATTGDHVLIRGKVTDPDQVLDTYLFVGARKAFYQSNRKSSNPNEMTFAHDVQLNPGVNVITVVARENEDVRTGYTLVVRRDGANGDALQTPLLQEFGADWQFHGAEPAVP